MHDTPILKPRQPLPASPADPSLSEAGPTARPRRSPKTPEVIPNF
jgi:hypothetical protein